MKAGLKHVYIFLLLVMVVVLVYLAEGISQQGTKITREIEFNRVDGHNDVLGNITRISATIQNSDTINHNYTITAFVDSKLFDSKIVEVFPDSPFTYSITIPIEKKYNSSNVLVYDPTHVISFTVNRDDSKDPIDRIQFNFG